MTRRTPKKNYPVGYKRPPVASQFQKGTSGNQQGRRRRSSSYFEALFAVLRETVLINENGARRRVTKQQAIWIRVTNAAATGDKKAGKLLARYQDTRKLAKSRVPATITIVR
jgi:hypothetical protein